MKSTEKRRSEVVRLIHPTPGRRINGREAGGEGIHRKRRGASKKTGWGKKKEKRFRNYTFLTCIFVFKHTSKSLSQTFRRLLSSTRRLTRQARESGCRPSHADPERWGLRERKISSRPSALCSWTNGLLSQVDSSRENTQCAVQERDLIIIAISVRPHVFPNVKENTSHWLIYERFQRSCIRAVLFLL